MRKTRHTQCQNVVSNLMATAVGTAGRGIPTFPILGYLHIRSVLSGGLREPLQQPR